MEVLGGFATKQPTQGDVEASINIVYSIFVLREKIVENSFDGKKRPESSVILVSAGKSVRIGNEQR